MRFKRLKSDDEVGVEEVLLQSCQALEIAAVLAADDRDVEGLLNTSAMFMKLCETIIAVSKEREDPEEEGKVVTMDSAKNFDVGFQRLVKRDDIVADEEEEDD